MVVAAHLTQEGAQNYAPNGLDIITDTNTHTGEWCELYFIENTVFNSLIGRGMGGSVGSKSFVAGSSIKNALGFTTIDLTSGSLIAYKL